MRIAGISLNEDFSNITCSCSAVFILKYHFADFHLLITFGVASEMPEGDGER